MKRLPKSLLIGTIALLALTGIALIGNGVWIKAKAELAQILLVQAFERVQQNSASVTPVASAASAGSNFRPWAWADIQPVARLTAPRLKETSIVLGDTSGEALAFGPGHLPDTPLPGEPGTSVLSGHRDTHFAWIKNLQNGDLLEVERANGKVISFRVRRNWVARYDNSGINADSEETLLALATCFPFDGKTRGPLRYIVEAEMVGEVVAAGR